MGIFLVAETCGMRRAREGSCQSGRLFNCRTQQLTVRTVTVVVAVWHVLTFTHVG
jgi:hypothetical protein